MATRREESNCYSATVLHWNYRGFAEFPLQLLNEERRLEIKDIYLKENLISRLPSDIGRLECLESLYLSGNDIRQLPREIGLLRSLKCLDLSGNRLATLPEEIGDVCNLKYLILDDNDLTELPLRLADLKGIRYLSVCDNKLRWLAQRPVYNYYHCELRFWRNKDLRCLPYSLWYHMFKDQQICSLNIGCLNVAGLASAAIQNRCVLKMHADAPEWKIEILMPPYNIVTTPLVAQPVSLLELCKRALYQALCERVNMISKKLFSSVYGDSIFFNKDPASDDTTTENNNNGIINGNGMNNVEDDAAGHGNGKQHAVNAQGMDINNNINNFVNLNEGSDTMSGDENKKKINGSRNEINNTGEKICNKDCNEHKGFCDNTTSDLVKRCLDYLPAFIKKDLKNGPVSRCENVTCKLPVFDFAILQFCLGKLLLIDSVEDVVLSAVFCSRACAELWARNKPDLMQWQLTAGPNC